MNMSLMYRHFSPTYPPAAPLRHLPASSAGSSRIATCMPRDFCWIGFFFVLWKHSMRTSATSLVAFPGETFRKDMR